MTHSKFFQYSLSFPLVMWAVGLLGYTIAFRQSSDFVLKNMFDALRVFVPYLIFTAGIWRLASNKPYRTLIFLAFLVPIVWGVFFTLCYMPYSYFKEKLLDWYILCIMGFWATFVAYLAEVIPYLILVTFKENFMSETESSSVTASLDHAPASPERS
jgi:hypothetical protein